MRKATWLFVVLWLLAAGYAVRCVAQSDEELIRGPVLARPPMMLDGDGIVIIGEDRQKPGLLSQGQAITGFALARGRDEVAFCAQTPEGRSALSVVTAVLTDPPLPPGEPRPEPPTRGGGGRGGGGMGRAPAPPGERWIYRLPQSAPRRLWTAPEGVTLRGPVWWSPAGDRIVVRATTADRADLVCVDYVSGTAVPLTSQAKVTDAAWAPDGARVAYVAQSDGVPALLLQTVPPTASRRLGAGGFDLRWSVDGKKLRWIVPGKGTWAQWEWNGEKAQAVGQLPPRAPGAMWSPDGRFCATLEGDPKRLVLYPTASTTGETVQPNGVQPQRLLGWSPDSRLVLVLAQGNRPVAVSVRKESEIRDDIVRFLAANHSAYQHLRASPAGPPMDPEAGLPSWSSKGDLLAYVWSSEKPSGILTWASQGMDEEYRTSQEELWRTYDALPKTSRGLIALPVHRELITQEDTRIEEDQPATRLEVRLLSNVKNIAMALQMFLTDHDALPDVKTAEEARAVLHEYLRNDAIWLRPDGKDVVVRYLAPPGMKVADIEDPASFPVVVVDYLPDCDLVGYADGHAKRWPKGEWQSQG